MLLEHVQHPQGHADDPGYSGQVGRRRRGPWGGGSGSSIRLRGSIRTWNIVEVAEASSTYMGGL